MPNPILANPKDSQASDDAELLTKIRQAARQSIADLDQAIGPLDAFRAEIAAKPKPTLSPLIERLKAKGYSDAEADDALAHATGKLRCSCCNAISAAACDCGTPYVRAGWRFFAEKPELLKQINGKGANRHDVTKSAPNVTKSTTSAGTLAGRKPIGEVAMSPAERQRRKRAKRTNGGSMIDQLFPKDSPACDFDWEHGQEEGESGAFQRARAAKWQLLEAERLAVEFALLRDGTTSAEIKPTVHIKAARKIARHWAKLADQLKARRRP
jgi:hypothetical protein